MCEIFIGADPLSYESRTRSVRLHGVVTSIRLEHLFWDVLDEIAGRDGLTVVQLIEKLYDELIAARGEAGNFASFLRVSALRYQALLAHQAIPADVAVRCAAWMRGPRCRNCRPTGRAKPAGPCGPARRGLRRPVRRRAAARRRSPARRCRSSGRRSRPRPLALHRAQGLDVGHVGQAARGDHGMDRAWASLTVASMLMPVSMPSRPMSV
jgi:predicted DNA-binding ribbon-helix-helix protein